MDSQHVMVATDLSAAADEALRQGHSRAMTSHAQLAVCLVVPDPGPVHPLFPARTLAEDLRFPGVRQRLIEAVTSRISGVTGRAPDTFQVFIEDGTPYAAIVRRAEAWGADLVVIGSHGATGLARIHLGSVAQKVVRYAHCPVLVARPGKETGQTVVGTDFSDPALPAVAAAAEETRRRHGHLTIVHSLDVHPAYIDYTAIGLADMVLLPDASKEMEETVDRRLADALARFHIEGVRRVCYGPAAPALIRTAEETQADLLVIGTAGRTGLRRVFLGSVAEAVVTAAPCSVLVVRLHPQAHAPKSAPSGGTPPAL